MKKAILLFLLLPALIFHSCKKSSSSPQVAAPTIIGTWAISSISGTTTYMGSPAASVFTTNYTYSNPDLTISNNNTTLLTVNSEIWIFGSDGTFSIDEDYENIDSTKPTIDTIAGWWDYTGNNIANSNIVLRTNGPTPTLLPVGGTFVITSVTSTQMVLSVDEYYTSSVSVSAGKNFTLTFTRQ